MNTLKLLRAALPEETMPGAIPGAGKENGEKS